MKTYRVYLKNGVSFTVQAHHFDPETIINHPFFLDEKKRDQEILVRMSEVVAVVPESAESDENRDTTS